MVREILFIVGAFVGFAAAVAGYLQVFHGHAPAKEVFSNACAATIGLVLGRVLERRLARRGAGR